MPTITALKGIPMVDAHSPDLYDFHSLKESRSGRISYEIMYAKGQGAFLTLRMGKEQILRVIGISANITGIMSSSSLLLPLEFMAKEVIRESVKGYIVELQTHDAGNRAMASVLEKRFLQEMSEHPDFGACMEWDLRVAAKLMSLERVMSEAWIALGRAGVQEVMGAIHEAIVMEVMGA